jgi:hypothetical protein
MKRATKLVLGLAVATVAVLALFLLPVVPLSRGPACFGGAGCDTFHSSARASVTYAYFGVGEVYVTVINGDFVSHTYCWMGARGQNNLRGLLTQ